MPSKRIPLLILCLALLTLAGCIGGISTDSGTPTTSESGGNGPTDTGTPTSTKSGGDERSPTIPDNATVVDYTALTVTQQQAFDAALSADEIRLMDGRAWDAPDYYYSYNNVVRSWPEEFVTLRDTSTDRIKETYVRRNTTYYQVTVDGPYCCAGKGERLSLTQIESPGNQTVTHLANHSGRAWDYLKYLIENGTTLPGWEVDAPVRGGVIEHQGDYYEVEYRGLYDFGRATMSVTKVEES
ncbi:MULTISPECIES: hypothetical protein [Salinibaculum]|uniref:hypothetical protein n=1 Tax=Salinibaculum TaxID=2732368 RepID=UPI0030D1813E